MAKWTFRLKGQPHLDSGFPHADYTGQSVRIGKANGRPVLQVMESNYDLPKAVFELDAVFGFLIQPSSVVRVWRRNPNSTGECSSPGFDANFADPGKLGSVETWDLVDRRDDPVGPRGRFLAQWVSEVSRGN